MRVYEVEDLRLQEGFLLVDGGNFYRLLVQKTLQVEYSLVGCRQFILSFGFNLFAVVRNALPMIDFTRELVRLSLRSVTCYTRGLRFQFWG